MASLVSVAVDDLKNRVKEVVDPELVYAYDLVDLNSQSRDVEYPFVGVVYGGMTRTRDDKTHGGLGQTMRFYVYIVAGGKDLTVNSGQSGVAGHKASVTEILDLLRMSIVDKVAPNHKKWIFAGETPQDFGNNVVGFAQVWELPAIIC